MHSMMRGGRARPLRGLLQDVQVCILRCGAGMPAPYDADAQCAPLRGVTLGRASQTAQKQIQDSRMHNNIVDSPRIVPPSLEGGGPQGRGLCPVLQGKQISYPYEVCAICQLPICFCEVWHARPILIMAVDNRAYSLLRDGQARPLQSFIAPNRRWCEE